MPAVMPLYASVGSNNLEVSLQFYGALLGSLGMKRLAANPKGGAFFGHPDTGVFAVVTPFDERPATVGNGAMIGFALPSNDAVDTFYNAALGLGATDEGPPGYRGSAYFAYFRDPEGNKLCAYHWVIPS